MCSTMPCSTVYDGFATIRRPRVGPRYHHPPRPPSLASVPENTSTFMRDSLPSPVGNPTIPWWELATRKSRYRSCPSLEIQVCIFSIKFEYYLIIGDRVSLLIYLIILLSMEAIDFLGQIGSRECRFLSISVFYYILKDVFLTYTSDKTYVTKVFGEIFKLFISTKKFNTLIIADSLFK